MIFVNILQGNLTMHWSCWGVHCPICCSKRLAFYFRRKYSEKMQSCHLASQAASINAKEFVDRHAVSNQQNRINQLFKYCFF